MTVSHNEGVEIQIIETYGFEEGSKTWRQCHQVDYMILSAVGLKRKPMVCKLMFFITWYKWRILIGRFVARFLIGLFTLNIVTNPFLSPFHGPF